MIWICHHWITAAGRINGFLCVKHFRVRVKRCVVYLLKFGNRAVWRCSDAHQYFHYIN